MEDSVNDNQATSKVVEEDVLKKIKLILDQKNQEVVKFDDAEIKIIKEMIEVYTSIIAFGRVGNWIKNILMGFAAFIAAYYAVHQWGSTILRSLLSSLGLG